VDFDARGIKSDSRQCSLNPAELVVSHGFAWLTDGARTVSVNVPYGAPGSANPFSLPGLIDSARRPAYTIASRYYSQVVRVNLDTLVQTTQPETLLPADSADISPQPDMFMLGSLESSKYQPLFVSSTGNPNIFAYPAAA
jgi:hypothetical protein